MKNTITRGESQIYDEMKLTRRQARRFRRGLFFSKACDFDLLNFLLVLGSFLVLILLSTIILPRILKCTKLFFPSAIIDGGSFVSKSLRSVGNWVLFW